MTKSYSVEFKKAAVHQYLTRGGRPLSEILGNLGISKHALYQWRDDFANVADMKINKKPQSRSASEKLTFLLEYNALHEDKRGEYLRQNGLHEEHLLEWRKQIEEALEPRKLITKEQQNSKKDQLKIKELQHELHRKDKALAEASALLILKKKASLLWGEDEEE